jgi:hypothetical protein
MVRDIFIYIFRYRSTPPPRKPDRLPAGILSTTGKFKHLMEKLRRPRKGSYIIAINFGGGPTPPPRTVK